MDFLFKFVMLPYQLDNNLLRHWRQFFALKHVMSILICFIIELFRQDLNFVSSGNGLYCQYFVLGFIFTFQLQVIFITNIYSDPFANQRLKLFKMKTNNEKVKT